MQLRRSSIFFLLVSFASCVTTTSIEEHNTQAKPNTLLLDNEALWELRTSIAKDENQESARLLNKQARRSLDCGPFSVTFKEGAPISGDKHDYTSLSPYYWPNPDTANHLPYVRRDGETNPETKMYGDESALYKMTDCATRLALTSYVLDKKEVGDAAVKVLLDWFVNPKTRMNPHLKYASARKGHPGTENGRAIGIEVGRVFPRVVDGILLLEAAGFLTAADKASLISWFNAYLTWLMTSPEGLEVGKEFNNIGTIYYTQIADIALFVGKPEIASSVLKTAVPKIIDATIEADGRQPEELGRTRSWAYSHTSLRHLFYLGFISDKAKLTSRIWDYQNAKGGSLQKALDFLVPYALQTKPWDFSQIQKFDPQRTAPFLWRAANIWKESRYKEEAASLLKTVDTTDAIWVRLGFLEPI